MDDNQSIAANALVAIGNDNTTTTNAMSNVA